MRALPDPADLSEQTDLVDHVARLRTRPIPRIVPLRGSKPRKGAGRRPASARHLDRLRRRVAECRDLWSGEQLPTEIETRTTCPDCGTSWGREITRRLPHHYIPGSGEWVPGYWGPRLAYKPCERKSGGEVAQHKVPARGGVILSVDDVEDFPLG